MPTITLKHQVQVLTRSPRLEDKLRQRCSRLLSTEICKEQRVVPALLRLQLDCVRVGAVRDEGGFSVVSEGEYLGRVVAIKDLETNKSDPDKCFKVR